MIVEWRQTLTFALIVIAANFGLFEDDFGQALNHSSHSCKALLDTHIARETLGVLSTPSNMATPVLPSLIPSLSTSTRPCKETDRGTACE